METDGVRSCENSRDFFERQVFDYFRAGFLGAHGIGDFERAA